MDIDEYIFYRKREEPGFTTRQMAKSLGLDPSYFSGLKNKNKPITSSVAVKIHEYTQGKVDGWQLIVKSVKKHEGKDNEQ